MQARWTIPAQVAAWLVGLVLLFVVQPPRLTVSDPPATFDRFVEFALVVLIGIIFALLPIRATRKDRVRYAIVSAILLLIAVAGFAAYVYLTDHWTCRYDAGTAMVIGSDLLPHAAEYSARHKDLGACGIVADYVGRTDLIWDYEELVNRRLILSALFCATVVFFVLSALLMLRAQAAARTAETGDSEGPRTPASR